MKISTSSMELSEWRILVELTVVSAIVAVTVAVLMPYSGLGQFKAKFSEVLLAASLERYEVIEQYAHAGEWSAAKREQEPPARAEEKPTESARLKVSVVDSGVAVEGVLQGRRFVLGMRPAVTSHSENWSMLWLCGARQAPAGWQSASGHISIDLPATHIPSVCRPEFRR